MTDALPRKLGRKQPDPQHAERSLKIGDYLTYRTRNLTPPPVVDHFSRVTDWGLYGNDAFSDCGPVAAANLRKMVSLYVTGTEDSPQLADVLQLYALQNPAFNPNDPGGPGDQGVDLQTMCEDLVKTGLERVKALGFAAVDVSNMDEIRECITLFGGLILGVNLEQAQQTQTDAGVWTYDPTPEWGRHAVLAGAYQTGPDALKVITWAQDVAMTDAFDQQQLEEAWVIIWPENLKIGAFVAGLDLPALAADYKQLTGKDFPVTAPTPAPVPEPAPAPAPSVLPPQLESMIQSLITDAEERGKKLALEAMQEGRTLVEDAKSRVAAIDEWLKSHGL